MTFLLFSLNLVFRDITKPRTFSISFTFFWLWRLPILSNVFWIHNTNWGTLRWLVTVWFQTGGVKNMNTKLNFWTGLFMLILSQGSAAFTNSVFWDFVSRLRTIAVLPPLAPPPSPRGVQVQVQSSGVSTGGLEATGVLRLVYSEQWRCLHLVQLQINYCRECSIETFSIGRNTRN